MFGGRRTAFLGESLKMVIITNTANIPMQCLSSYSLPFEKVKSLLRQAATVLFFLNGSGNIRGQTHENSFDPD